MFEPGSRVGHYEVVSELGRGGMAIVFLARDIRLEREVALKCPRLDRELGPEHVKRFLREARAAARLSHPNIVPVIDVFEHDGLPVMTMELVDGENLRSRMGRSGTLPLEEILRIAEGLAEALEAAHASRVLHRDVTPNNVLVGRDGRARLTDFGLAHLYVPPGEESRVSTHTPVLTVPGRAMGTPGYMSPEQLLGKPVDPRTDLFSLGAVIYEMCSGQPAFRSTDQGDLVDAVLHREPDALGRLNYEIPEELERIVRKALAKRVDERYQTAADMLADIRTLRRRSGPQDVREAPTTAARGRRRSLPWILLAGVVAVFTALMVWWGTRPEDPAIPTWTGTQVTADPGWEMDPALSPDGQFVAYSSNRSGNSDIWVVSARGGEPLQLTDHPADDGSPAWFPDGSALAFRSNRGGEDGIWKVAFPRGSEVPLVADGFDPTVSPEGRRIAFARRDPAGYFRIAIADLDDPTGARWLTNENAGLWDHRNPAWSPDGRTLCYNDHRDLWTVRVASGAPRRLTFEHANDSDPAWSPGGKYIYFSSKREGSLALWRVPAEGGAAMRLTSGTGPESNPSVSRDGRLLVHSTFLHDPDIVLMDIGSGQPFRIAGSRAEGSPAFTSDGSRLVFESDREGDWDLWVQPLERGRPTGTPRRLTDLPGSEPLPTFSPDGRWIAHGRVHEEQRDVWITPAAGGISQPITQHPGTDAQPTWSPDGQRLAFLSDRDGSRQIWIVPIANGTPAGEPTRLTSGGGEHRLPVWSPTGELIAYLSDRGNATEVWIAEVDDGSSTHRVVAADAAAGWIRWDPTDPEILLVAGTWGEEAVSLRRVSLRDGAASRFDPPIGLDAGYLGYFDITADGKLLAYVDTRVRGDIWTLETHDGSF